MEETEVHIPTDHPTVTFRWRTDFFLWLISEDPDMESAGKLISAYREGCGDCMNYWAKEVTENEPLAVMHLLGSAYSWARIQTGLNYEELGNGENPLFSKESVKQIKAMTEQRVSDMIRDANAMPKMVLYDCLDDAMAAMTVPATHPGGAPHKTPPPWEEEPEMPQEPSGEDDPT